MTFKIGRRGAQGLAAALALVIALLIAWKGNWVFATTLPVDKKDPTFAQLVFSDRATVGFVRFGLVLLALYVIASIPALMVGGRWLKGFTTTGLTADDPVADAADTIKDLQKQVTDLQGERDEAKALVQKALEVA